MKNNPLIVSLLIGLIVVLVIAGVSILVKMNSLSSVYKKELAKNISSEKSIEDLNAENESLQQSIDSLNIQLKDLKEEHLKLDKFKDKLEENLKDELMKQKLDK